MKKLVILFAALGIAALNVKSLYAQGAQDYARRNFKFSALLASAADDEDITATNYAGDVSEKAVRTFQKMFKDASNVSWSEENRTVYSRFNSNGVNYRNFFTRGGNWIGGIRTYGEDKLPKDVRAIVKPQYYDYAITLVDEVNLPNQLPVYVVHLEDATSIRNVAVQNGEIRVLDQFYKSK
jgi:peptidoglycan hydrolase-like protein with peptidoglycan-binding domain